jgi:hypothetical protein
MKQVSTDLSVFRSRLNACSAAGSCTEADKNITSTSRLAADTHK